MGTPPLDPQAQPHTSGYRTTFSSRPGPTPTSETRAPHSSSMRRTYRWAAGGRSEKVRAFETSSPHPSNSSYTALAWWNAVWVIGISSRRSPSTLYPTQIGTFGSPDSTSSLVTTRSVIPLTRTAYRPTTASNQPQRRAQPAGGPDPAPALGRWPPRFSDSAVGSGPGP